MISAIANLLGKIIRLIYNATDQNYFISIIVFTILTRLILVPLYIKQMKSNKELNEIGPLAQKIQEKYKNDKNKQAEEMTKLYAEHKVNPVAGCLPALIQIPLVLAMFYIVKQPLTYVINMQPSDVKSYTATYLEKENVEDVTDNEIKANEILIANEYNLIDMDVGGVINLGYAPSSVFSKDTAKRSNPVALVVPLLSIVISVISMKISQKNSNMSEEQKEMQKSMNLMMPLLSASISYSMPLALGIYWLIGSLFSLIQQIITNKMFRKNEETLKLNKGGK